MAVAKDALRDWHRLFGLVLMDFFTDSPFTVEIEPDLSRQQQFLDVLILRQGAGHFEDRLPDGLDDLTRHNLLTFKSHHETLDEWAMKELIGHYVAYRKFVSSTPSDLLPEERFRLYAVCARFPQKLSGQVPWQQRQTGVYDCQWGTDAVRVVVAGQLPREPHNALLHLFSASPELVGFGGGAYRQHSENTSSLIRQLFHRFKVEDLPMSYTMEDFKRDYVKEHFEELTPEEKRELFRMMPRGERQEVLRSLPLDEQQEILQSLTTDEPLEKRPANPRKPRKRK